MQLNTSAWNRCTNWKIHGITSSRKYLPDHVYLGVHLWCAVVYTPLKCYKNGIIADTLKSHCVHNLRVRSVCVKLLLCMFVLYIRYCNIDKPIEFVDALPPAKNVVHACTGYRGFEPVYAIKQSNPTLHTSTKNSYYYSNTSDCFHFWWGMRWIWD